LPRKIEFTRLRRFERHKDNCCFSFHAARVEEGGSVELSASCLSRPSEIGLIIQKPHRGHRRLAISDDYSELLIVILRCVAHQ